MTPMSTIWRALSAAAVRSGLTGLTASATQAAPLRIASAFDPQTMDPHGLALLYHSRVVYQIYDSLVNRDTAFKLEPSLAVSWQMTGPTQWRFKLRPGVKFHDGTAFSADDVLFSIHRALGATSQRSFTLKGIAAVKKVDALTVDFQLLTPDAVLPDKLLYVPMVSQAWCQAHGVEKAQDFNPKISVASRTDLGTQYLTFDQARDELLHSDVKGRNPFKDRRVRQAVAHAINIDLIVQKVLRGQATPTGSHVSPLVDGYLPELDQRLPFNPTRARALLAEAGYPAGFGVTLDCVNVAWREAVCQAAAAMLTQVGIRTTLRSSPTNQFFPKLSQATASFVEYGWTPTSEAWSTLNGLFRTWDPQGGGTFNAGRYSNPALDVLIDAVRTEPDLVKRRARVGVALRLIHDDLPYIPLYRRKLNWAMAKNVQVVQWPNDAVELRWVRRR